MKNKALIKLNVNSAPKIFSQEEVSRWNDFIDKKDVLEAFFLAQGISGRKLFEKLAMVHCDVPEDSLEATKNFQFDSSIDLRDSEKRCEFLELMMIYESIISILFKQDKNIY